MKKNMVISQLIYLLVLTQGCESLRFVECKKDGILVFPEQPLATMSPYKLSESTFMVKGKRPFYEVIRLPDSLGGLKISGRLDADVMLNSKKEVKAVVVNALDLNKGKNKRFFHDYFPKCQNRPFKKKYHAMIYHYDSLVFG